MSYDSKSGSSGHAVQLVVVRDVTVVSVVTHPHVHHHDRPYLTQEQAVCIIQNVLNDSKTRKSQLQRVQKDGSAHMPLVQISVFVRDCSEPNGGHYVTAWNPDGQDAAVHLAQSKAYTASALSTNHAAVSTTTTNAWSDGVYYDLCNISMPTCGAATSQTAGGFPLYVWDQCKTCAHLVGGVGVAGDVDEVNQVLAVAGTRGYEAPENIRAKPYV